MSRRLADVDDRYPVYVNIWKKDVMDSHRETTVGIEKPAVGEKALQLEEQRSKTEKEHAEEGPDIRMVSK